MLRKLQRLSIIASYLRQQIYKFKLYKGILKRLMQQLAAKPIACAANMYLRSAPSKAGKASYAAYIAQVIATPKRLKILRIAKAYTKSV